MIVESKLGEGTKVVCKKRIIEDQNENEQFI